VILHSIPLVKGLTESEQTLFAELANTCAKKAARNAKRTKYYEGKNRLKDLGIAIPPQLRDVEMVVGWPAKAVDLLAERSIFDGFVFSGQTESEQTLSGLLEANGFSQMYRQAASDQLIHSCAFLTVSAGRAFADEPPVLLSAYSALNAAAKWDFRKKRIAAGLTVVEVDKHQTPLWLNLYTDAEVVEMKKSVVGWRVTARIGHSFKRPLMEALVYRPSLERPFGRSRISRAVMSITDSAVRASLRAEVSAEFFTSPQRYLLGADDDVFSDKSRWEAYIGAFFAATKDEDGETPTYGQLPQASMEPHVSYFRSLAARFAGETGIPISSLGVIHDNPSSAEAIYAAREDLIISAQSLNAANGAALATVGKMALALAQKKTLDDLTPEELSIQPKFRRPDRPSVVSQSDAIVKQASVIPWLADTRVILEELGYDEAQIERLMADKRAAIGASLIEAMQSAPEPPPTVTEDADAKLGNNATSD
jgi:hypothetical protein